MTLEQNIKMISPYAWEIPVSYKKGMRCPARIYVDRDSLRSLLEEKSLEQLVNVACLPGAEYVSVMPDAHLGYGFPIGGVAAIDAATGVISPGGVGYDINCGVRILTSSNTLVDTRDHLESLATQIQRDVPSGVGRGGNFKLTPSDMNAVLNTGLKWALSRGYAEDGEEEFIEERGSYVHADADFVSEQARKRGEDQLGTIGSGNHFIEIQVVNDIYDEKSADIYKLFKNQIVVMIHTGSRGLGHQVCSDYVKIMNGVQSKYNLNIPDRELSSAPFYSDEGQSYFKAMAAAANFAWTNRQIIQHQIRGAWKRILGAESAVEILYDVAHNIAKLETHNGRKYIVHRKGATRAFGPGSMEVPEKYREVGQPVLIPGSMGTFSYVLAGTESAMSETFGSSCHGAGRRLSRMKAKKTIDYNKLRKELSDYGVVVRAGSARGLLEEAPQAYKDVDTVIDIVARNDIARPVARLKPLAVIKG